MPEAVRDGPRDPRDKLLARRQVARVMGRIRREGLCLVFTNGVFDLLHPGHVRLLRRARLLGDRLVVGVNTDASVRRLKGPRRPLLRLNDRALMLASLEAVDYVVTFTEDSPLRIIELVKPDILVKGSDWKAGTIVGSEFVERNGGRVIRVPIAKGFSTTRLARDIQRRG
ncbi:MAG: D-glycero-beta-D-manno-heptose 1-phosphate adenylyltransferase [Acidobacteriota bacterium]